MQRGRPLGHAGDGWGRDSRGRGEDRHGPSGLGRPGATRGSGSRPGAGAGRKGVVAGGVQPECLASSSAGGRMLYKRVLPLLLRPCDLATWRHGVLVMLGPAAGYVKQRLFYSGAVLPWPAQPWGWSWGRRAGVTKKGPGSTTTSHVHLCLYRTITCLLAPST
ncbi:hypothetical protein BS50DRAFT_249631 [Corynespora cassiicola Philippines]|uniref:Uncharacterized protein n=1 Tax=Corynespora cassiicola Philippines TaxID=1448308 RepID=A0A2T2P3U3_CORCC|nr:hypothetical protein BS50DRAFT_249631 [Corynespora cassiicola Philippines]